MLYIFDWDGTLLDSTNKIVDSMQAAIEQLGLPYRTADEVRHIIGLGLPEAIATLFPAISSADNEALRSAYSARYIAADQQPCPFFPDVESVLAKLRSDGHHLAVATGKSRRGLNRVLANLQMEHFFDASRCADETASKPNPLMLMEILNELEVAASDAIMVGDTEFDLAMAVNAGVRSIGVSYGVHSVERLSAHGPELVVDNFVEILEWQSP